MPGLCGVIDTHHRCIGNLVNSIENFDNQKKSLFCDEFLELGYVDHAIEFDEQPATTENVSIWCWGEILGHEYQGQYTSRSDNQSDAEYCATLYNNYGLNFIAGLNSEFSGVIYDHDAETISLFTDRLGSRPVYYTRTPDGCVVFSSLLQSLAAHPEVSLKVDSEYISEFFTFSRVFGVYTPVKGIQKLPPASLVTFNNEGELVDERRYWWPTSKKQNRSFSSFVDEFEKAFCAAVGERTGHGRKHGLLLSGGADSRLLIESFNEEITSFHMNEKLEGNREAETAQRVAQKKNSKFNFLRRSEDYYPEIFEQTSPLLSNFNGLPSHSHAIGFADEITDEVDSLFSGHYADTILGCVYLPVEPENRKLVRHLIPPLSVKQISSKQEFIEFLNSVHYTRTDPLYFDWHTDIESVLHDNIDVNDGQILHHEVPYPDWTAVTEFGMIYPLTNGWGYNFYETTNQFIPTKYPFLDNRIIDIAVQMPLRYKVRKDIVGATLRKRNPELASIPHPSDGLPLHYPNYIKHYGTKASALQNKVRKKISSGRADDSIGGGGSWPNHATLIRQHSFVGEILEKNEDRMRTSPYLDYDAAQSCYTAHLDGENYTRQLYALVTVLESALDLDNKQNPN